MASIVALTTSVMLIAACARPQAEVQLATRVAGAPTAIGAPSAISMPAAMSPADQVLTVLASYTTALERAEDSRNGAIARRLLTPYLAARRVAGLVEAMSEIWSRGQGFSGEDLRHVSSVTVGGQHAFVHDCDNTSGMTLVDIATGQIVPGSAGTSRANVVTRLDLVSGHWLVQFQLIEDVPCAP